MKSVSHKQWRTESRRFLEAEAEVPTLKPGRGSESWERGEVRPWKRQRAEADARQMETEAWK